MAEKRVTLRGPGYQVAIAGGAQRPQFIGRTLVVGYRILELDVKASMLGESIASLLLPPISVEGEDSGHVESLIDYYRFRVVLEQTQDLVMRFGPLTKMVGVPPEYPAVARMSLNKRLYPCVFNEVLESGQLMDEMRREYGSLLESRGLLSADGTLVISRDVVGQLRRILSDIAGLVGSTTRIGFQAPRSLAGCEPSEGLRDPGTLLSLPEGRVSVSCDPDSLARIAGARGASSLDLKCNYASPLSSSLICDGDGLKFIVKEYTRMQIKWIPASIASAMMYKYRVSPKSRMSAEYRNLRVLRRIIRTPKIYGVCGTYYSTKMVREYIEGEPVASSHSKHAWRLAGEAIAMLHDNNIAVGDPNPGNFIVTGKGDVALIDAEQAARFDPKKGLWDLIVFTLYSLALGADENLVAGALREYFNTARKSNSIIKEAEKEAIWATISLIPSIGLKARQLIMGQIT